MTIFVFAGSAMAQSSGMDSIVQKIGHLAAKNRDSQQEKTGVVVFAFFRSDGKTTELGARLAGELGTRLAKESGIELITKQEMEVTRKNAGWMMKDWVLDSVGYSVAYEAGAQLAISGKHSRKGNELELNIQIQSLPSGKKLGSAKARIPFVNEWATLDSKLVHMPSEEEQIFSLFGEVIPPTTGTAKLSDGVTPPECIRCPDPSFTSEARKENYSGKVYLAVVIDETGHVQSVRVVKPAKFGLTERATRAVRDWRFKAATRNKRPVPVEVIIEVTFRLF